MANPIFIVGSPRSGTTLLYHMLLSAGGFAVYRAEAHVFNTFAPRFGHLRTLDDRAALLRHWLSSEYFRRSGLTPNDIQWRLLVECTGAGDFLRLFMDAVAAKQGVPRWAECTPENLLYVDEIKRSIPNAQFVHIIRDGRDVATSLAKQGWIKNLPGSRLHSTIAAGLYWEWMVGKGRENLSRYRADSLEVRYESLIADPQRELNRIGAFIQHPLDYGVIQRTGIGTVSAPNTSFKPQGGQFNPVGRWRSSARTKEFAQLEEAIMPLLTELGYSLQTQPSFHPLLQFERVAYRAKFSARHRLKTQTPLGRYFTNIALLSDFHAFDAPSDDRDRNTVPETGAHQNAPA